FYIKDSNVYPVGPESSIAVALNDAITIAPPPPQAGYDGWGYMASTATNAELLQTQSVIIPFGSSTSFTQLTTGTAKWDATNWNGITVVYRGGLASFLLANSTYYFYPAYDVAKGLVRFPWGIGSYSGATTTPQLAAA